jgi:hypothetical protein
MNILHKCRALIESIPTHWLQQQTTTLRKQFEPLNKVMRRIVDEQLAAGHRFVIVYQHVNDYCCRADMTRDITTFIDRIQQKRR